VAALIRIDGSAAPVGAEPAGPTSFCSRCGEHSERPPRGRRVCETCEAGVLLSCAGDALPAVTAAFLICTSELTVTAMSEAAEAIFGRPEADLVGAGLLDLLTSPVGDEQVARHAGLAALRESGPVTMPLRVVAEDAPRLGTLSARIATCGPPRAALVVLEPSRFGRR
jgi:PAS domain-containing protein